MNEEAPARSSRIDLRLAPAALAVWVVTLAAVGAGWFPVGVLAGLLLGAGGVVWLTARTRRWFHGFLAVVVLAGFAAMGVAVRMQQIEEHPLRETAKQGERATVRVVLAEKPRELRGISYGARRAQDRALVRARLQAMEATGNRIATGGSVLLLVPSEPWGELIAEQGLTATDKAVVPRAGDFHVAVLQVFRPPEDVEAAPGWQRAAERLREGLRQNSATVLGPAAAGLLPGIVVGDTGALPSAVERDFTTAGLSHLTAVSGANLAIVCGAVLLFLRLVGTGPWLLERVSFGS